MTAPARGEIWLADLNPTRGREQPEGGTRAESAILCERVRSVSLEGFVVRWGAISRQTMAAVEDRLRILLRL
jgi:mRNA interferase MazF